MATRGDWPSRFGTRSTIGPVLSSTVISVPRLIRYVVPGVRFCQAMEPALILSAARGCAVSTDSVLPRSAQMAMASSDDLPTAFGADTDRPPINRVKETQVDAAT